jgi:hypothetical protein
VGFLFVGDASSEPPFGLFGTVAGLFDGLSARANFLSRKLFCRAISPDPLGSEPIFPDPNQTRRAALAAATADPQCVGCHAVMDPLGFPLEALTPGTLEYRTTENGQPLDTSGVYLGEFEAVMFSDMDSLAGHLQSSCEVARCLAVQLFEEAASNTGTASGTTAELDRAVYLFAGGALPEMDRFRIRVLLEAIVSSPSFLE